MTDDTKKQFSHELNGEGHLKPSGHTMEDEYANQGISHHSVHKLEKIQPEHFQNHHPQDVKENHTHHADHTGHEQMFRTRFWVSSLLSLPVLLFSSMIQRWFGFSLPSFFGSEWIPFLFSTIVFIYGGIPFIKLAIPELRNRNPGMMTLISLAISVAFVYSVAAQLFNIGEVFFWELVTLIDIMLLGHWLEMRSIRQASGALSELAKLMPDTAELVIDENGNTQILPVDALKLGDVVLVRPGATIPVDGEVIDGESSVNEAMITGESKPVDKAVGSKVIAGTLNEDGSLRIRVTATGEQTALAGIMRLIEQAQKSKSKTQLLADKAAGWLFYIALGVSVITAVGWTIAVGFNIEVLKRVVTVLVIACPHALGLAVPLVVAITTSIAAKNGILVRDRLALEAARNIDVVIFDKTGTLTEGKFGVVGISTDGWQEDSALALAAAIESDSEHLIARAIRNEAESRHIALPTVSQFSALKGRGVQAIYEGKPVYVGGPRLLEMLGLSPSSSLTAFANEAGQKSQSVVYLIVEKQVVAAFAVADVIRSESKVVVNRLHEMGIEVAMLTGDSQLVAKSVAAELGIDRVFAEVLPEHKEQKVAELQSQGKRVAMVGDGVNDAPALTRADVGIAIGGGTDVAIESAGLILVKSNPLDVVKIIQLSRSSYNKMVQNLWWAAGYNIVALPLAAGILAPWNIFLSPAIGALLMSLSTIIVAINAQFLRRTALIT
ncbi:copper-translocating P-type ATPase [Bellilinea sp.]|uniref:copper-translocating P-type ATPase n=1 Tax=Bellilinea sp. TaxID=2838785 RepID=UPI0021DEE406|nr:copper-translocating P-type ATPase [Bellilinea sp.]GIV64822.1 MAG: copper-translocating P-type ATPase [Bellilinea sp.]